MSAYENACVCGKRFDNNCAHFLSNWLIKNDKMEVKLPGCYPCSAGRPIRAKEVREYFLMKHFNRMFNDPGKECFIYCEQKETGQGHVYFGTKTKCVAGTGLYSKANYFEYFL
uniref:SWIM-type domain-containing protein n=1 Tax=Panagrolaimus sp. ES5 TaxID=591445 RepID=A0AC34FVH0_9BILA